MQRENSSTIATDVLDRARYGDEDAWDELACHYTPLVYRWCRLAGVPQQDTVDITQDVLMRTMKCLPDFSRDRSRGESLTAWMYTVTRHRICDFYRQRRPGPAQSMEAFPDVATSHSSADAIERMTPRMQRFCRALDAVREEVDGRTWTAFWRLAVDGEPVRVIASELGLSEGAVRQAKYRVVQKLRSHEIA